MPQAPFTFITGATGGLGRAFAFACAEESDLFLTGRSAGKLARLKEELLASYPSRRIEIFPADLTDERSRAALYSFAAERELLFSRVICAAGADIQKAFEKYTEEKLTFQCRINFEAAVSCIRFALSRRAATLEVLAISSISGVYPMPYFAIYSAAKGALTSFCSSLRREMKGSGVSVTSAEPGGIYTRPDVCEYIAAQGLWGKLSAKSPEWVARKCLAAARKNKRVYRPGFLNKCVAVFPRLLPLSLRMRFIARRWSRTEKDAF